MNKMNFIQDFLSREWNLYGLQIACGILMIMVLHNYLTFMGMFSIGLCVYLIAICQRILGIRYGMVISHLKQDEINKIVKGVKKLRKERKNKEKKDV